MIEEFRYFRGKKVIYEVSNLGRVKRNGEIIELGCLNSGYLAFSKYLVHRAVAELFIPNPENKKYVDHIDTNIYNNTVDNLRWVTASENMLNPLTRKHNSEGQTWQKGENNPMYKCERTEEWRTNHSNFMKEHNPMKNSSPHNYMTEEEIKQWRENLSKAKTGTHLSPESLAKRREKMRLKKLAS